MVKLFSKTSSMPSPAIRRRLAARIGARSQCLRKEATSRLASQSSNNSTGIRWQCRLKTGEAKGVRMPRARSKLAKTLLRTLVTLKRSSMLACKTRSGACRTGRSLLRWRIPAPLATIIWFTIGFEIQSMTILSNSSSYSYK